MSTAIVIVLAAIAVVPHISFGILRWGNFADDPTAPKIHSKSRPPRTDGRR